jgi:hypothetical protein
MRRRRRDLRPDGDRGMRAEVLISHIWSIMNGYRFSEFLGDDTDVDRITESLGPDRLRADRKIGCKITLVIGDLQF